MTYTDVTIPIRCSECDAEEEGMDNMMKHIITDHPDYTPQDAIDYSRKWMETAYAQLEDEQATYYFQRKEDPSE